MTELEKEIGGMIIETLNLDGVVLEQIDPEEPLFEDGLGLDSIDALELSVAIAMNYGVHIKADDTDVTNIFSSLRALTKFIEHSRQR